MAKASAQSINRAKLEEVEKLSKERIQILDNIETAHDLWKEAVTNLNEANTALETAVADLDELVTAFQSKTVEINAAITDSGVGGTN